MLNLPSTVIRLTKMISTTGQPHIKTEYKLYLPQTMLPTLVVHNGLRCDESLVMPKDNRCHVESRKEIMKDIHTENVLCIIINHKQNHVV